MPRSTARFPSANVTSKATWPRRTKLREFKGNVAHSNHDGFMGDRAPRADGHFAVGGYISLADPANPNSDQVESVIEDFTGYKNRNSGIWARGELRLYKGDDPLDSTDLAVGVDDNACIALMRLFNEPAGRAFLAEQGVPADALAVVKASRDQLKKAKPDQVEVKDDHCFVGFDANHGRRDFVDGLIKFAQAHITEL